MEKKESPKTNNENAYPYRLTGTITSYDPMRGKGFLNAKDQGIKKPIIQPYFPSIYIQMHHPRLHQYIPFLLRLPLRQNHFILQLKNMK